MEEPLVGDQEVKVVEVNAAQTDRGQAYQLFFLLAWTNGSCCLAVYVQKFVVVSGP